MRVPGREGSGRSRSLSNHGLGSGCTRGRYGKIGKLPREQEIRPSRLPPYSAQLCPACLDLEREELMAFIPVASWGGRTCLTCEEISVASAKDMDASRWKPECRKRKLHKKTTSSRQ